MYNQSKPVTAEEVVQKKVAKEPTKVESAGQGFGEKPEKEWSKSDAINSMQNDRIVD